MGHANLTLDLSPTNIRHEDHELFRDMRESGGSNIPHDHFWTVVFNDYYLKDMRQTGSDHRFIANHPIVGPVLRHYHEIAEMPPTMPTGVPGTPGTPVAPICPPPSMTGGAQPPPPPIHMTGVPEPATWILLAVGMIAAMIVGSCSPRDGR